MPEIQRQPGIHRSCRGVILTLALCAMTLVLNVGGPLTAHAQPRSEVAKTVKLMTCAQVHLDSMRSALNQHGIVHERARSTIAEHLIQLDTSLAAIESAYGVDENRTTVEKREIAKLVGNLTDCFYLAIQDSNARAFETGLNEFPSNLRNALAPLKIAVIASGDVNAVLTNPANTASVAVGSLGISLAAKRFEILAVVSVASNADTVKSSYGAHLLNTIEGFRSGYIEYVSKVPLEVEIFGLEISVPGIYVSAAASSAAWQLNFTHVSQAGVLVQDSSHNTQVSSFSLKAGFQSILLQHDDGQNTIALRFRVGATFQGIAGDLGTVPNKELRREFLGRSTRYFIGPDLGFSISFNKLVGTVGFITYFLDPGISGFSGGQLTARIQYQANIFNFQ